MPRRVAWSRGPSVVKQRYVIPQAGQGDTRTHAAPAGRRRVFKAASYRVAASVPTNTHTHTSKSFEITQLHFTTKHTAAHATSYGWDKVMAASPHTGRAASCPTEDTGSVHDGLPTRTAASCMTTVALPLRRTHAAR